MAGDDPAPEVGDFRRGVEADRPAVEGGLAGRHIHGADESGAPVVPGAVGHRGVDRHGCRGGDRTGHGERAAGAAADIAARQRQRCGDEIQRSGRCAGGLVQRRSGRGRQETGDGGRRSCQRHRHCRSGRGAVDTRRGQDRVVECGSRKRGSGELGGGRGQRHLGERDGGLRARCAISAALCHCRAGEIPGGGTTPGCPISGGGVITCAGCG